MIASIPPLVPIRHPLLALFGMLLFAWSMAAAALPDDSKQPIQIEADSVEIDDGRQVSIYAGSVVIQQGSMHLWADKVTVHHKKSRQPNRIIAVGKPARFRQLVEKGGKPVNANALRIEYDADSDEILLIDKAVITQNNDSFRSDRIRYDRANSVVKAGASAKGRERVKITLDPANK